MKIKKITPLNDGMSKANAEQLWDAIAGFAAYSFNKSHSYEYSLISWATMWIKVYYPAEFYAAAMTVIDDEDKLEPLVADAQTIHKLRILPPDINRSTDRIEIDGEDKLYAPFQAIKGISTNVSAAIMKLRAHAGGKFTSMAQFDPSIQKTVLGGSKVNAKHRDALGRVGALHSITGEGFPPTHPSRLKDRIELIPGFTVEMVKPDRELTYEHLAQVKLVSLLDEIRSCDGCSLKGRPHPLPRAGSKPKFMMVFDAPNWREEKAGKMLEGEGADLIKALLNAIGLKPSDGYYTSLVRSVKPKDQKMLSNEQINGCSKWLKQEIEILKPPVILAMGSNAVRFFSPGMKGAPGDLAGKVIFDAELDASIIFGVNPAMVVFNPAAEKMLADAIQKLGDVLS